MTAVIWYSAKLTMPAVHANLPEWWQERICDCEEFGHSEVSLSEVISDTRGPWRSVRGSQFPEPSNCTNCGKWSRAHLRICDNCRQHYYHFFRHPGSGVFGTTYCWNCCRYAGKYAGSRDNEKYPAGAKLHRTLYLQLPYAGPPSSVVQVVPSVEIPESYFDFGD